MVVRWKKRIRCHPEPFACHLRLLESDGPIRIGPEIGPEPFVCHPEPFAGHSERSEESRHFAQDKLREGAHGKLREGSFSFDSG